MTFSGGLVNGIDDLIKDAVERIRSSSQQTNLVVVLDPPGGYIEVVQRIVETMRHHYKCVDFIVPNSAYSAGTVLAMSGDAIYRLASPLDVRRYRARVKDPEQPVRLRARR